MDEDESDEQWASVVIPAHNEEDALPRLLVSLLGQELKRLHLEVIAVVNGSSDGTAAAAGRYVSAFAAWVSTLSGACVLCVLVRHLMG
jgi:cellulose synthase/poly-beta-1,6-N-acetylglucosamine synthase-like glycosyltransferase